MTYTAKFKNSVVDTVLTGYAGGAAEKEQRLTRLFENNGHAYSREEVKKMYYANYTGHGGYRTYEEFTSWIFN